MKNIYNIFWLRVSEDDEEEEEEEELQRAFSRQSEGKKLLYLNK